MIGFFGWESSFQRRERDASQPTQPLILDSLRVIAVAQNVAAQMPQVSENLNAEDGVDGYGDPRIPASAAVPRPAKEHANAAATMRFERPNPSIRQNSLHASILQASRRGGCGRSFTWGCPPPRPPLSLSSRKAFLVLTMTLTAYVHTIRPAGGSLFRKSF